jgi:hypothetical protein
LEALNEFDRERRVQGRVMTLEHSYDNPLVRVSSLIKLFKELQQEKTGQSELLLPPRKTSTRKKQR